MRRRTAHVEHSRRRPLPEPADRVGVGSVEPGVVKGTALGDVSTANLTLDRAIQGYLQPTSPDFTAGAGAAASPTWGAPTVANRLAVQIGPVQRSIMLMAHGYCLWRNQSGTDFNGRLCFVLFDGQPGNGGSLYQRNTNVPSHFIPSDANGRGVNVHSLITVPKSEIADWWLTFAWQNNLSSTSGSQAVSRQSITAFAAGPIPGYDPTVSADGGLT